MKEIFKEIHPGALIGATVGLLVGLVVTIMTFISSPIIGGICLAVVLIVIYFTFKIALLPTIKRAALRKNGVEAEATVLDLIETGWTVNRIYPVIKLRLEVHPHEGEPFQAETREVISRLEIPQFQPGAVIPVIYDPRNRKNVSVGTIE